VKDMILLVKMSSGIFVLHKMNCIFISKATVPCAYNARQQTLRISEFKASRH